MTQIVDVFPLKIGREAAFEDSIAPSRAFKQLEEGSDACELTRHAGVLSKQPLEDNHKGFVPL
ncbi:MAG: hypothetical protein N3F11_02710 [Casimicrobiaceae bacterium]|nr:hypothetical protein [Casimicrobiaceae bacterium]